MLLLRRAQEYENVSKSYSSDVVKLLIPNNFVTKLIGASIYFLFGVVCTYISIIEGCMIREIAAKAGGAQIKILSDKQSEKGITLCIIFVSYIVRIPRVCSCYSW